LDIAGLDLVVTGSITKFSVLTAGKTSTATDIYFANTTRSPPLLTTTKEKMRRTTVAYKSETHTQWIACSCKIKMGLRAQLEKLG